MSSDTEVTARERLMWFPPREYKLRLTRLRPETVRELLLKVLLAEGTARGIDVARMLCVPFPLLEEELLRLKQQHLTSVVGGAGVGGYENMDYALTDSGRQRALEVLALRPYVGPAPVDLSEYVTSVEEQALARIRVSRDELRDEVLADMVLGDQVLDQLGAALASGGPLLLHGHPGNGKTFLAEHMTSLLRDGIFVPHAIEVDGQVIRLYDTRVHRPVPEDDEVCFAPYDNIRAKVDSRWVFVYRPFVLAGGELNLSMLDLVFQEAVKTYEAPFQLKANCGLLLVDDLGRQRVEPRQFLNRWIYPLEKGVDYLTLANGKKIEVPFRQLLVFSTNLEPGDLADEAFWRRIRYKLHLADPSAAEFRKIFERECERTGLAFVDKAFVHLIKKHYRGDRDRERAFRACHPRDLIQHMLDFATYRGMELAMSEDLVDHACRTYFLD